MRPRCSSPRSYHLGYSDFRSEKLRKPSLATLSPLGAPLAHIGLHVSAVVHAYDTDTFLPRTHRPRTERTDAMTALLTSTPSRAAATESEAPAQKPRSTT